MPVMPPTIEQLRRIADQYYLHLSDADLQSFLGLMAGALESYRRLDQLIEPALPARYSRSGGYRPGPEENPCNAWYWKCSIKGAASGPLSGKRIALKDNVCVAGVPMMNGSAVLEGYTPEFDATIVTRILDAGGEIAGKAVCENLCASGSSFSADTGPVLNPHDPSRSAGGSSSGSAALVVAGECDIAIGADQGGSIRIPSSWCGAYGLKPTYGLVPYTGVFPMELTLDHVGPIAATVADLALLLDAIAGADGVDPRQKDVRTESYSGALTGDVRGLRIGVLEEGFGWPGISQLEVDDAVRAAAGHYAHLGAEVRGVSIPLHRDGMHIWTGIATEGALATMLRGNASGTNWKGHYCVSLLDAFARGRITRADDLWDTVKLNMLLGQYMENRYHGRYYAKAQNIARVLTKAYDDAFHTVDLLLLPTLPMIAPPLPIGTAVSREEKVARQLDMIQNVCPINVSGHPALTVPCGLVENLPVGMMLVGRRWEDATVLRAAHAFEETGTYAVRPSRPGIGPR